MAAFRRNHWPLCVGIRTRSNPGSVPSGPYAIQNSIIDVYWMIGCGILGYFLRSYGYQTGPVVLGIILGPLMDASYRCAMISVQDEWTEFLRELLVNPLSLVLTLAIVLMLASQTPLWSRLRAARRAA